MAIAGAQHTPPPHFRIQDEMDEMMKWFMNTAQDLYPVVRAAKLHSIFVGIHPFIDGNGRTSRLLLNLELMKAGYPPIIFKIQNRLPYYEALDKSDTTQNFDDFIQLTALEVEDSLDLYLSVL